MNLLFTGIYNKLIANTAGDLYVAVGGRFYLNHAPQNATLPYCIFSSISSIHEIDFGEEREDTLIQFDIFSENNSADEAGDILGYLKTLMDDCALTVTGWRHVTFSRGNVYPNNDFSQVPPVHGYSVEYNVMIEKTK